ncbi:Uncharacterised protein [uncultured archaeon]|nr:Uncharacterised protein [uncultured archaeon]
MVKVLIICFSKKLKESQKLKGGFNPCSCVVQSPLVKNNVNRNEVVVHIIKRHMVFERRYKLISKTSRLKHITILAIACLLLLIPILAIMSKASINEQPDFTDVKLWNYDVVKRANYDYFWTAANPSMYVTPNNPIIQYYANNTDEVQMDYKPDYIDYWQNPDYTLKIMQGDCEDQSLVWVSIHRAEGHKAIAVGGYLYFDDGTFVRDIWYEYVNGSVHQTKFVAPITEVSKFSFKPLFMFNDQMSLRDYDPNWMLQ